eukprot:1158675-Pelagomonas_calceolata.AAC.6
MEAKRYGFAISRLLLEALLSCGKLNVRLKWSHGQETPFAVSHKSQYHPVAWLEAPRCLFGSNNNDITQFYNNSHILQQLTTVTLPCCVACGSNVRQEAPYSVACRCVHMLSTQFQGAHAKSA